MIIVMFVIERKKGVTECGFKIFCDAFDVQLCTEPKIRKK